MPLLFHRFRPFIFAAKNVPGGSMMTFDFILSTLVANNGNRLCELLILLVVIGLELTISFYFDEYCMK